MPQSEEAAAWFAAVYQAVQQVPHGKVTSYGHIAKLLGHPERPRQVGICLKHLPIDPALPYHNQNVPWQRIINSKGTITVRGAGEAQRQAQELTAEGVEVGHGSLGEMTVDFAVYGWFPEDLPDDLRDENDDEDD